MSSRKIPTIIMSSWKIRYMATSAQTEEVSSGPTLCHLLKEMRYEVFHRIMSVCVAHGVHIINLFDNNLNITISFVEMYFRKCFVDES